MDRPDRMPAGMGAGPGAAPGPPATQPALRGIAVGMAMPDNNNPAQARRPLLTTAPSNGQMPPMMPLPPLPNGRNGPPPGATSPATPILTAAQVISLTREAMRHALENESQAVDVGPGLKSGVTIDLSRKGIQKLPEEVVDIVKNELERLALSHNQLSSLPARFAECVSLRYLNIRGNQIKEFPLPLCELKSLEILDLGRNQLRVLPPDIARLSSLKVLSIPKNQIRELPVCLAEMTSLQVLKFEGNPISFPPRDALQIQSPSPSGEGSGREGEVTEVAITAHIKKFMKLHLINGRDAETTGDESSEGTDTPRMPLRRMPSGRFPIKVSSSDASDMRVPSGGPRGPPPIPSRSHYRGLSQQNTTTRRPGVLPLTIGNISERGRSNSETLMHSERSNSRQRRMGILAKKATSDLGTLDEVEGSNRWSHYRGLSHGSAMQGNQAAPSRSPATPTDSLARPVYVRRLSVLPERRRESKIFDPVIEAAKGILYSVFQIHPMIQMLMTLTNDGSAKRSSLEIVFYNTNSHVEELEQEIQKHDMAMAEDEEGPFGDNANVHRACQTLVGAYGHVCTLLADNIDTFVNNGDARYIRTLLMLIYNSIMELRVTLSSVFSENTKQANVPALEAPDNSNTIKPYFREAVAAVPAPQKPAPPRNRNGPVMHNPSNLRVATDIPVPYNNGGSRTAKLASATPRSNDSFSSSYAREGAGPDFSEEDAQFDKIYLALQRSTDIVLHILPNFHTQLTGGIRNAMQQRAPSAMIRDWKNLIAMCVDAIQQTEILKNRLSLIKLKDPGVRSHAGFWSLCSNFISAWTKMASKIKSEINTIPLPPDTRARLRPVHQSMKETSIIIMNSPWNYILRPAGSGGGGSNGGGGGGGPQGSFGPGALSPTTPQVPITPQSAALGPAMQATVATPQTGSFAAAFHGNVFERAETLMTNPGISMSRNGTMSRGHSGFNSLSSVSSMSSDGVPTPSSAFSPSVQVGAAPFRVNGGKVAI